ncbi:DUF7666 domain-containing protein [Antrihabitans cavernicola]|uniref:DUF7666 domain-containing protein n=1 Tax=Antrihabitans cavernicola TaxID=2495913 RepID=A0A5A7S9B2_9NOCA|nr:hypothetical protein [Spelaeibacter cavernicola]KAA0021829.1 hypothetical protein FOY51_15645 [Spelaeibacter cavernicola]
MASRFVAVHLHSQRVILAGGVVIDLTAIDLSDPVQWCEFHGVTVDGGIAYVYKAVNDAWTTDRGFDYSPGSKTVAPDWDAAPHCGNGLHFGATPGHSRVYMPDATKFVRVGVAVSGLVPLGGKCKAAAVVVAAVEVDRWANEVPQ